MNGVAVRPRLRNDTLNIVAKVTLVGMPSNQRAAGAIRMKPAVRAQVIAAVALIPFSVLAILRAMA